MDKRTPRWKNVPTPSVNAQLTLIGTMYQVMSDGSVCVEVDSVALPSATSSMPSFPTPGKDMTVGNQRKFAARAPARKKKVDESMVSNNDSKMQNVVEYVFSRIYK